MQLSTIIPYSTAAGYTVLDTSRHGAPGCLSIIGAIGSEEIIVQRPLNDDPDPANAAHWGQLTIDTVDIKLTATAHAKAIPVGMLIRVEKPATAAAVGVRWS